MSLIADALKKAQTARLGRRYAAPDPSGVVARSREVRRGGGENSVGSLLSQMQFSPTLLIGLGSGILLFAVLFSYFFLSGRSLKARLPGGESSPSVASGPSGLILAPPPSVPGVEPLILEDKAAAAKAGGDLAPPKPESQPAQTATAKSKPGDGKRNYAPPRKAEEDLKEASPTHVAVTPELSEEVRQHFNLALFYQEERNFPQARSAYEKVVQMWPLYAEAHNNLGVVYKELGMYDRAATQLKKALTLNPRYAMAYHNLGVIYQLRGEWKQAIEHYDAALSLDGNHLSSYNNLGLVYRAQHRPHQAREVLERALAINPGFAQTHYNLALVLEESGELERAGFHFQKFIDLAGEENRLLIERVRAHLEGRPAQK